MRTIATIVLILTTAVFCFFAGDLPTIGDPNSPPNSHVTPYYIENSAKDTGSPNIVTGVLADYRGFDTLGETSVMFVAGLIAILILTRGKDEKFRKPNEKGDKK